MYSCSDFSSFCICFFHQIKSGWIQKIIPLGQNFSYYCNFCCHMLKYCEQNDMAQKWWLFRIQSDLKEYNIRMSEKVIMWWTKKFNAERKVSYFFKAKICLLPQGRKFALLSKAENLLGSPGKKFVWSSKEKIRLVIQGKNSISSPGKKLLGYSRKKRLFKAKNRITVRTRHFLAFFRCTL